MCDVKGGSDADSDGDLQYEKLTTIDVLELRTED